MHRLSNQDALRKVSLTQMKYTLNKLSIVPDEMIKDDTRYVYNIFNSRIKLENHTGHSSNYGYAIGIEINNNDYSSEICRNFMTMAKLRADDITVAYVQCHETDGGVTNLTSYFGNQATGKSNYLRNMDMVKMDNACKVCEDTVSCFVFILIGYAQI